MNRIIVIPDIHGRNFWKGVLKKYPIEECDKIVFLGDYLDPYDFENISVEKALENFKEIIEFKRKYSEKVVLLFGNHDIYYYLKIEGPSRYCRKYRKVIENLYEMNRDCFQLAYETEKTLFTHSGYIEGWEETVQKYFDIDLHHSADSINSLLDGEIGDDNISKGIKALMIVSRERGGRFNYGSCIWADLNEHNYNRSYDGKFQVFGHTLQLDLNDYYKTYSDKSIKDGEAVIQLNDLSDDSDNKNKGYAMLDCRHGFLYNEDELTFEKI